MKTSKQGRKTTQPALARMMVAGLALVSGGSHAVTATGTASATVVGSAAVIVTVPPPAAAPAPATPVNVPAVILTPPALSGTVFTVESFTGSLSTSGPLLRAGVAPATTGAGTVAQPAAAVEGGAGGATPVQGSVGAGAVPPAASTATVSITRRPDGSLAVSGGSILTFAVSQPVNGAVNIEYN